VSIAATILGPDPCAGAWRAQHRGFGNSVQDRHAGPQHRPGRCGGTFAITGTNSLDPAPRSGWGSTAITRLRAGWCRGRF